LVDHVWASAVIQQSKLFAVKRPLVNPAILEVGEVIKIPSLDDITN
jgi:hypothetical protein